MLKKEEVYVEVCTKKQAKKLKKVLDMFGEKTFEKVYDVSFYDCVGCSVLFWEGKLWAVGSNSYADKNKTKVSIKELRNILAIEHLKEGDVFIGDCGSDSNWVCKFKGLSENGNSFDAKYKFNTSEKIEEGRFTNFIRYATEEEKQFLNPKPKELEVGKWYKHRCNDFLALLTDLRGRGYGFDTSGYWFNESGVGLTGLTEANPEEVKEALIKEAKHRGLVEGAVCNNSNIHGFNVKNNLIDYFGGYEFNVEKNELRVLDKNEVETWYTIFKNGKWAEVVKPAETQTLITDKDVAILERLHDTLHDAHGYSLEFELMKSARVLSEKLRELSIQNK